MALQVWLPLNGDLTNQGLAGGAAVTASNVAYAEGKIGKAASFSANSAQWIHVGSKTDFQYTTTFSYACWFCCNNLGVQMILSHGRDYNKYGICIGINSAGSLHTIIGTSDHYDATGISSNTWCHYAVTYNNGTCCTYLNGSLLWSGTVGVMDYADSAGLTVGKMSFGYTNTSAYHPFNGLINDVRVYDHCLSVREIKELSKGLVLHYTLGNVDGYIGGRNLFLNTFGENNKFSTNSAVRDNYMTYFNGKTIYCPTAFKVGDTITVSAKSTLPWSSVHAGTKGTCGFWLYLGTLSQVQSGSYTSPVFLGGDNASTEFVYTYTIPTVGSLTDIYIGFRYNTYSDGTDKVSSQLWDVKLEKGSVHTPWTPAPADAPNLYSTTIYDTSGYKYNGTISGTVEWNTDTPRYRGSYKFTSATPYIYTNSGLPIMQRFTFVIWGKGAATRSMLWGYSTGGGLVNLYFYGGYMYWNTGDGQDNPFLNNNANVSYPTDGAWHHYVVTGDGTTATLYIDGVKKGVAKTYKYPTRGNVALSSWANDRNYPWLGSLSDFRVYSTALSADDVKELYELGATLANNATLMSYEYVEDDGTTNLSKGGDFTTDEVIENDDYASTASISDSDIKANNYIEW